MGRPKHVLTDAENAEIKSVYRTKLGWDYDDFCCDKHGTDNSAKICRNPAEPKTQQTFPARPHIFHHAPPGQKAVPDAARDRRYPSDCCSSDCLSGRELRAVACERCRSRCALASLLSSHFLRWDFSQWVGH